MNRFTADLVFDLLANLNKTWWADSQHNSKVHQRAGQSGDQPNNDPSITVSNWLFSL